MPEPKSVFGTLSKQIFKKKFHVKNKVLAKPKYFEEFQSYFKEIHPTFKQVPPNS